MHWPHDYLEPQPFLIVYSAFLPFICCSLIHFSSAHRGCVSRAAGTALCKDIVLPLCAQTAHTQFLRCMEKKFSCVYINTHKLSSRVNKVLEFLKAPPSQRQTLFYSSTHPSILPLFLTSSRQFCMWVLTSLLPPLHLTLLVEIRVGFESPLGDAHKHRAHKKDICMQLDTVYLKHITTDFIISDRRAREERTPAYCPCTGNTLYKT